jgi:acyl-coenzyme A synthetase/AMP-(fatty) acid ligase
VKDRLSDDASVDSPDIGVSVADGEATLTGYVASRQTKRAAEACANRIGGIKHVQNTLRIKTKLAILAVLNGRLARLKHPRRVAFVSAMPRNLMGKVQKNLLRAQFADAGNP